MFSGSCGAKVVVQFKFAPRKDSRQAAANYRLAACAPRMKLARREREASLGRCVFTAV